MGLPGFTAENSFYGKEKFHIASRSYAKNNTGIHPADASTVEACKDTCLFFWTEYAQYEDPYKAYNEYLSCRAACY